MAKRVLSSADDFVRPPKRAKISKDQISTLSNEITLRIFHFLPVRDLNTCQTVSRYFQKIATDSQVWKSAYYDRFVRPRLQRLPGRRQSGLDWSTLSYSSRQSKWLGEGHLVRNGNLVDWKKQYKIRHNWSRGSCGVSQIPVADRATRSPMLARLHDGIVYTVDYEAGLRSWSYKDVKKLLATKSLAATKKDGQLPLPTAFALDSQETAADMQWLVTGCKDGAFSIYGYCKSKKDYHHFYTHPASSNGTITAIAISRPYILCMTDLQLLSLYKFDSWPNYSSELVKPPLLLASLKSRTVWPPVSLSMRKVGPKIVASVAYSMPSYLSGWSVGIQELQLSDQGGLLSSRTASALAQGFTPLTLESESFQLQTNLSPEREPQFRSKPTSLSYSHPYILMSHSDNTLTLHMATSTASELTISAGRKLFGHTSSVFSAHVEERGKAVSVGIQENDIRLWDLEGNTTSGLNRSRPPAEDISVRISPGERTSQSRYPTMLAGEHGLALGPIAEDKARERLITMGWVGFDHENLVVLREQHHGVQALAIYDFS